MFKLYEISDQYRKAIESISDDNTEKSKLLDEILESFDKKIINYARCLKNLEAEATAIDKEIDAMKIRRIRLSKQFEWLETHAISEISNTGLLDPIKCPQFTVKLQDNPVSVDDYDKKKIPEYYKVYKQAVSINKDLIKKDIQQGFNVPGARLIRRKKLVIK